MFPRIIVPVNKVDFRITLWRSARGVDMMPAKVASKIEGLLDRQVGEVLVSEGNDLSLGDKESQLVLPGGSEFAQLDTCNFGADGWSELLDLRALHQQVFEGGIGILPVFNISEGFERRVFLVMIPSRQVVWILPHRRG
jgi:hypothetical protein